MAESTNWCGSTLQCEGNDKFVWGKAFGQTPNGMLMFSDDPDYRSPDEEIEEEALAPYGPVHKPRSGPTYIPILHRVPADKTVSDEENEEYTQSTQEFQDYDTYDEAPDNIPDLIPSNPLTSPHLFGQDKFGKSTKTKVPDDFLWGLDPV